MTIIELNKTAINNLNSVCNNKQNLKNNFSFGQNSPDSFEPSQNYAKARMSFKLTEIADDFANKGKDKIAENYYQQAIKANNDFVPPYYGLAKVYKNADKTQQAIETYEKLLELHPEELEAQTLIGHCYKKIGDYDKAKDAFQQAYEKDPKYDYAARSLKEIDNLILAKTNPELARQLKEKQTEETLRKALKIIINTTPQKILDNVSDVKYSFGQTDSLSGHPNIAQYEDGKRKIIVTDEYRWAAPEIVAAYLQHEDIHGSDKDGITSICEEQDAYEASVKFWLKHNNGIKDPELDYALQLYNQNPQALRNKVAEIYKSRDKEITELSPNHPPANAAKGLFDWSNLKLLGKKLGAIHF